MAHVHCMVDNYSYTRILRICKTYCFSTAMMFYLIRTLLVLLRNKILGK